MSSTFRPELLSVGEHFALEVRGDSMIEAGILDGDIALISAGRRRHGDIVVALIDDEEATLKRFRRRGASIALEPANPVVRGADSSAEPCADSRQARRAFPPLPVVRGKRSSSHAERRLQSSHVCVAAFAYFPMRALGELFIHGPVSNRVAGRAQAWK